MVFSIIKVALAMDEAKMFDDISLNLELRANNLHAFSKVGNYWVSMLANLAMITIFLGVLYLMFPQLRTSVFAFRPK